MSCICFKILDVFKVKRKADSVYSSSHPWTSVSFRFRGESTFITEEETFHAGAGSVLYLPNDRSFYRQSTDEEMLILHLQCYNEDKESLPLSVFYPESPFVLDHFLELFEQWNLKAPGYEHKCHALLHTIFAHLEETTEQIPISYKARLIHPGVICLDTKFTDPDLSIKQLAEICNISEEYFRRIYKELYGRSPCQAITDKRILTACSLLQSGYFSIEEVATRAGFQNSKYFSTLFRKKMQISPVTYKKNWKLIGGISDA